VGRGRRDDVPAVCLDVDPRPVWEGGQQRAAGVPVVQVPAAPARGHGGGGGHQRRVDLAAVARVDVDHGQPGRGAGADGQQPAGHLGEHGGQPGRVERGGVESVAGQAPAPGRVMPPPGGAAGAAVGDRALGPAEHEYRPAAADVAERGSFEGEPRRGLLVVLTFRARVVVAVHGDACQAGQPGGVAGAGAAVADERQAGVRAERDHGGVAGEPGAAPGHPVGGVPFGLAAAGLPQPLCDGVGAARARPGDQDRAGRAVLA